MSAVVKIEGRPSLIATMAAQYGIDADKMMATLKATAFRGDVTTEQMMALYVVANQYGLNPWTKEIYAFPDRSGIIPVVGLDGWARIINTHKECNGVQFKEADDGSWVECTIFRKDREFPTTAREWLSECRRNTQPWQSHPRRMLRHKALIQCARICFGFVGIYEPDEAERIVDVTHSTLQANPRDGLEPQDPAQVDAYVAKVVDILAMDVEEDIHGDHIFALHTELNPDAALYVAVLDALKARKVLSRAGWDKYKVIGSKRYQAGVRIT